MIRTMTRSVLMGLVLMALSTADRARAAFITYTQTASASGSLDGMTFTNAQITITGTADTSNVTAASGYTSVILTSASFTVAGVGSGTFMDIFQLFDTQGTPGSAYFQDNSNNEILVSMSNDAFLTYDLKSSIGPVSGFNGGSFGATYGTTGGNLLISSFGTTLGTFTGTIASVPEPSSLALCGIAGIFGMAVVKVRRKPAHA